MPIQVTILPPIYLKSTSSVSSSTSGSAPAALREQLFNQRMEGELKGALGTLQTLVADTNKAASDSTVIDDKLANFWQTYEEEEGFGRIFSDKKTQLRYNHNEKMGNLSYGVAELRREIERMPAGTDRDKAMAKLEAFNTSNRQSLEDGYKQALARLDKGKQPIIRPEIGLLSEEDGNNTPSLKVGGSSGGVQTDGDEEEFTLKPPRFRVPVEREVEDDDDNITFRPPSHFTPRNHVTELLSALEAQTQLVSQLSQRLGNRG
ncbi:hypothetical protein SDC9_93014 [bioreactor metagenome]|uniref:Uncharacterized protein n=1 Tax=bioreactor metagenome TaxID=1076179 RepID=A0A645A082_9ZZZZ